MNQINIKKERLKGAFILLIVGLFIVQLVADIKYAKAYKKYEIQEIAISQLKTDYKILGVEYIAKTNSFETLTATKQVWGAIWYKYFETPPKSKPVVKQVQKDSVKK